MPSPQRSPFPLGSLLVLILFDALTPWSWAALLHGAALLAVASWYLPAIKGLGRWFAVALAGGSAALAVAFDIPPEQVLTAATNGGQVLGFLLLVEVLGAAIQAGRYDSVLTGLLAHHTTPSTTSLRRAASVGAFFLSLTGMFMGAVPAAFYALGGKPGREGLPLAISASRGFGASSLINPVSPLVVLALAASGTHFFPYLACALPLAALLLVLDWYPRSAPGTIPVGEPASPDSGRWRRRQTLAAAAALVATLLVYQLMGALGIGVLPRIGLAVCAGGAALGLAEPVRFVARLRTLPRDRFNTHAASAPYFAAGALFGTLLVESGLLAPLLNAISRLQMPLVEFPLLVALVVVFRLFGLAPVITLMIVGPLFAPAVSLPPAVYALSLGFGAVAGFLGSPLSGTNLFVASVSGLSPFEISLRFQGRYVVTATVLASLYAAVLTRWLS